MEALILIPIIVVIMILYSFLATISLNNKNSELREMLRKLEMRLQKLESQSTETTMVRQEHAEPAGPPSIPYHIPEIADVREVQAVETVKKIPPARPKPAIQSAYWTGLEKQFIDNWIGIIGSIAMVMGVAFISIYAALKMAPFNRFLLLTGFSVVLFTIYAVLRSQSKWLKLGVWLRSSGCAVFLFACLGSGGIPGLKWITAPLYALMLLLVGVGLNLIVGTWSGSQFFASFHAIISLAALTVAPQSTLTLGIAAGICVLQVLRTYRDRWEYHLLVTVTAFLAYQLYWFFVLDLFSQSPMPPDLRWTGIIATAVIGITTMCVHYREVYGAKTFERLPFLVHLLNWIFMGIGFLLYSTGSKWNTLVLMAASLAAFFLARRAKKLAIRWLFVTDTLIAEAIALLAISTLQRWQFNWLPMATVLILEVIVFLWLMLREEETIIRWTGIVLYHVAGILIIVAAWGLGQTRVLGELPVETLVLAVALAIYTAFSFYLTGQKTESFDSLQIYGFGAVLQDFSLSGFLSGILGLMLFGLVFDFLWFPYVATVVLLLFLELRHRYPLKGFSAGTHLLVVGTYVLSWYYLREFLAHDVEKVAIYGAPFLLVALYGAHTSFCQWQEKYRKHMWIYLFSIHLVVYSFTLLNILSPLAPGTFWLLLAPLYLELALFYSRKLGAEVQKKGEVPRYLMQWGYLFMGLFLFRHWTVHIYSSIYYLGGVHVRLLQELLALAVFIYWALAKKPATEKEYCSWTILHPLMWELSITFAIMTVALEVPDTLYPLAWVVGAFLLLFLGTFVAEKLSRFRFYALVLYWAAAFHIAFISTMDQMPAITVMQQAWFRGLLALLLQLVFLVVFYTHAKLETVVFPEPLSFLRERVQVINRRQNVWIYYPYFMAAAFFLYWTFDHAVLTLLWVVETFVIFTLSLVLRENHFRYAAMIGLAACLVRLVFYDLARSGTITRALVFLGVGLIMILMNTLYTKYRGRFHNE